LVKNYGKSIIQNKIDNDCNFIKHNILICEYCNDRNFRFVKKNVTRFRTSVNIIGSGKNECHICNNLFQKTIHAIQSDITKSQHFTKDNQEKKIDIGTSLPLFLFEKEDNLRSLFRIKGLPNIKNQYNNILRAEIMKETGCSIDHLNPDIRIQVFIDSQFNYDIKYKTRSLLLLGKYNKYQRGLGQRINYNNINKEKKKVHEESLHSHFTIEDAILEYLYVQSGSKNIKIAWSGSEDKNSLVLGNGRPFIVKIDSPQFRNIKKIFDIKDKLRLIFKEIQIEDINKYYQYKIQINTLINIIEGNLDKADVEENISKLIGDIRFQINNKTIKKKIYSSSYKIIDDKNFEMKLLLDNGIPIKQLIGGKEFIEPCLSNLINKKCECLLFDIDEVILNHKKGNHL
jgi:tRNA pseudouridine synthase 10